MGSHFKPTSCEECWRRCKLRFDKVVGASQHLKIAGCYLLHGVSTGQTAMRRQLFNENFFYCLCYYNYWIESIRRVGHNANGHIPGSTVLSEFTRAVPVSRGADVTVLLMVRPSRVKFVVVYLPDNRAYLAWIVFCGGWYTVFGVLHDCGPLGGATPIDINFWFGLEWRVDPIQVASYPLRSVCG